ncbi:cytoplasmic phosphatidylinositol transfer protein 1-like [Huso huso]|uniref:Cytoplasmic phosphatidylinositol transfer protein 1-like n=1 Tax=Huso huso TaxID=61971 RepID=A0ABR0Y880_HUSHU
MLVKEYRICMPLTVEEYRIGQLYMISKHSLEQSSAGEGVEVTVNEPCEDPKHGRGQYTEKRIYLNSKLPGWAKTFVPKIFYITERAWNYYPFTITGVLLSLCLFQCSFLPKLQIRIETKFENNRGDNNQVSPVQQSCIIMNPSHPRQGGRVLQGLRLITVQHCWIQVYIYSFLLYFFLPLRGSVAGGQVNGTTLLDSGLHTVNLG